MKSIRSFTILHNNSNTERIKVSLEKVERGYVWKDEEGNTIADEGIIYNTIEGACKSAKILYNNFFWKMKCKW